ncbi:hypothetical protein Rsub_02060 [Raphidocelis subcapitata]|uniref:RRM domain-containing protein n=1 Tax=Raphidocelis subcapitata TaxID=307507 RepID=A0A2V0NPD9_9CHLO|nr:hypothetical protein Rsub_02060 [Raphidocelis subcapitata]|eukprot:GBF89488.1 hypothetical protein Rsub_02060 [Raphidocelis subcapitata]
MAADPLSMSLDDLIKAQSKGPGRTGGGGGSGRGSGGRGSSGGGGSGRGRGGGRNQPQQRLQQQRGPLSANDSGVHKRSGQQAGYRSPPSGGRGRGGGRVGGGYGGYANQGQPDNRLWRQDDERFAPPMVAMVPMVPQRRTVKNKLFLSNLDPRITEEDITELFHNSVGGVVAAAVHFSGRGEPMGTGHVVFESESEAQAAVAQFHNVALDGRVLQLELVESEATNRLSSGVSITAIQAPAQGYGGGYGMGRG